MLTPMATARRQPCQLDRRIKYETTIPAQTERAANAGRKFAGICGGCGLGAVSCGDEAAGWPEGTRRTLLAAGGCCPILVRPDSAPPMMKVKAKTRHTAPTLIAVPRIFPTVIAVS